MERASQTQGSFPLDSRPGPPQPPGHRRARRQGAQGSSKEPICSLFLPLLLFARPVPLSWTHCGVSLVFPGREREREGSCQAVLWASGRKGSLPSGQCHTHSRDGDTEAQRGEGMPPGPPSMPGPVTVAMLSCFSPSWLGGFLILMSSSHTAGQLRGWA